VSQSASIEEFSQLILALSAVCVPEEQLTRLHQNSRQLTQGDVWLALAGEKQHALAYLAQALTHSPALILAEDTPQARACLKDVNLPIPLLWLSAQRGWYLPLLSKAFPLAKRLKLFGITGTNGKSSSGYFLAQLFAQQGESVGMLGTLGFAKIQTHFPVTWQTTGMTTPDAVALYRRLQQAAEAGMTHLVMEVSSHALMQERIAGLHFTGVALTQITQDHLDYHHTLEAYAQAKLRLFTQVESQTQVVNLDDGWVQKWRAQGLLSKAFSYGKASGTALQLVHAKADGRGWNFTVRCADQVYQGRLNLLGGFQLENLLLALSQMQVLGYDFASCVHGVKDLVAPKGRMESVATEPNPILVDFAHTPDALESVLTSLRQHVQGKLWCVFGAGGDRDASKRPLMGRVVSELSDAWVVTDDNPRSESPEKIRHAIIGGQIADAALVKNWKEIGDRTEAIRWAIAQLQPGDLLLVAGKGHETGQEIAGRTLPYSDFEAIAQVLAERKERQS
jgi:UDP-N-acetylmuramoyl-L-alanyl-D-glutamate--2,6-diaminopimelate ligase